MMYFRDLGRNSNELLQSGKRFGEGLCFKPTLEGKGTTSKGKVGHSKEGECIPSRGNTII